MRRPSCAHACLERISLSLILPIRPGESSSSLMARSCLQDYSCAARAPAKFVLPRDRGHGRQTEGLAKRLGGGPTAVSQRRNLMADVVSAHRGSPEPDWDPIIDATVISTGEVQNLGDPGVSGDTAFIAMVTQVNRPSLRVQFGYIHPDFPRDIQD